MKKKNGFISVSSIYAFLIIFLLLMSLIILKYANNRVTLEKYKLDIKRKSYGATMNINILSDASKIEIQSNKDVYYAITNQNVLPGSWSEEKNSNISINVDELEMDINYVWIKDESGTIKYKRINKKNTNCESPEDYSSDLICDTNEPDCISKDIYRTRDISLLDTKKEACINSDLEIEAGEILQKKYTCFYNNEKIQYVTKNGKSCPEKYMGFMFERAEESTDESISTKVYDCYKYGEYSSWQEGNQSNITCSNNIGVCAENKTGYCEPGIILMLED